MPPEDEKQERPSYSVCGSQKWELKTMLAHQAKGAPAGVGVMKIRKKETCENAWDELKALKLIIVDAYQAVWPWVILTVH